MGTGVQGHGNASSVRSGFMIIIIVFGVSLGSWRHTYEPGRTLTAAPEQYNKATIHRSSGQVPFPGLQLLVSDEDGDGVIVVSEEISIVYGEGKPDPDAVQDYLQNLVTQFLYLEDHDDRLVPGLQAELISLRHHMMRAS